MSSTTSVFVKRARWTLCGLLIAGAAGCTQFQSLCTSKWIDTHWVDTAGGETGYELFTMWNNQIHVTQDTENGFRPLPGLAGRFLIFRKGSDQAADAAGEVLVMIHDMSKPAPGVAPPLLTHCRFDPIALKQLKRKQKDGDGYTLFIPWENYRPDLTTVQIQLIFYPKGGQPIHATPELVRLQSSQQPAPVLQIQNSTMTYGSMQAR